MTHDSKDKTLCAISNTHRFGFFHSPALHLPTLLHSGINMKTLGYRRNPRVIPGSLPSLPAQPTQCCQFNIQPSGSLPRAPPTTLIPPPSFFREPQLPPPSAPACPLPGSRRRRQVTCDGFSLKSSSPAPGQAHSR